MLSLFLKENGRNIMKKIQVLILSAVMVLVLTSCSQAPTGTGPSENSQNTVEKPTSKSAEWEADEYLSASPVARELIRAGVCDEILDNSDGVYGSESDMSSDYYLGEFVICTTEYPPRVDESCPANIYVRAGANATFYNPKRPLLYEDGVSVALFYGENYQVEVSPLDSFGNPETLVSDCASKVAIARETIGGSVTVYGQYDSYPEENETEPPAVEKVSMPNLVGSIDGNARNWLSNNGYEFNFDIQSTGYNPQISCLMAGNNYIVDQEPRAGSTVENSFSTSVVVYVDCEW
jgi:hypothetical protein